MGVDPHTARHRAEHCQSYERAAAWFARYGSWPLLFSWLPIVGDPLTVIAGAMRVDVRWFLVLVGLGKATRYAVMVGSMEWLRS
jgi:membrane protein YqaA with SNARE-associated domain